MAASVTGTTFLVGNGLSQGGQNPTELLVEAYRRTRQPAVDALNTRATTLQSRQTFFNSLRTKLESAQTNAENFTATDANTKFVTRKVTASDSTYLSITADSTAAVGVSSIKVNRLATNDVLLSDRVTTAELFTANLNNRSLSSSIATGSKQFTVNGQNYNLTLDGSETNEGVAQKIANAVNANTSSTVNAAVVKDTGSTLRLTFTAKSTGEDGKVSFTDTDNLLSAFGLGASINQGTTRTLTSATTAGYRTAASADLNSNVTVNGIDVSRSSNTLSDVLQGISITLNKAQAADDSAITLTTAVDSDKVKSLIQPLLDSYNDSLRYLKSEAKKAGNDGAIRSLSSRLRSLTGEQYGSDTEVKSLADLGITVGSDGTISVTNNDRLKSLLESDPSKVAGVFTGTNGFASRLKDLVDEVTGSSGLAQTRSEALGSQIKRLTDQRKSLEGKIDREVEQQKKEYQKLQETYYTLQGQLSQYSTYR